MRNQCRGPESAVFAVRVFSVSLLSLSSGRVMSEREWLCVQGLFACLLACKFAARNVHLIVTPVCRSKLAHRAHEKETDRQTDRDRDTDRDRETERDRDIDRERQRDTERYREIQRDRDRQRQTERQRQKLREREKIFHSMFRRN